MHVHVRGADGEAKFWLTPTVYLADSDGLDARTLRDLRNAVMPHPWHGFRDCLKQHLRSSHWWSLVTRAYIGRPWTKTSR